MAINITKAQEILNAKRDELNAFSKLSKESRDAVTLDQQSVGRLSRMDAMQQKAMADAQERKRALDLQRIEMAERRIKDGEYGYCVSCGEEIAEGRLAIDPMAERCIRCA